MTPPSLDDDDEDHWCSWCNRDDAMRAGPPEGPPCHWCGYPGAGGITPEFMQQVHDAEQFAAAVRDMIASCPRDEEVRS